MHLGITLHVNTAALLAGQHNKLQTLNSHCIVNVVVNV